MGLLRRGMLWENIAVPELRSEAKALADHLSLQTGIRRVPAARGSAKTRETGGFTGA